MTRRHHELLHRLALETESRIVLLVLDGVGDVRTATQPLTPLERATTPNLDLLAAGASLGRLVPVSTGITPGSGPGHLALFGYDPIAPEHDVGRGVLEALGLGLQLEPEMLVARGNFATVDREGLLTDRRAGRIASAECRRLVTLLNDALAAETTLGLEVRLEAGEGYRFVLIARPRVGEPHQSTDLADTDPQRLGAEPLPLRADSPDGRATVERLEPPLATMRAALAAEPRANSYLLRGFSHLPQIRGLRELYGLRAGAFAGYPLYRGVASACGMDVIECGKEAEQTFAACAERWNDFRFFFVHIKQTDMAGEDGNADFKTEVIEQVDRALPRLLDLKPDVLAITGDHSTPAPMKAHSWHPVPILLAGQNAFADDTRRFTELEAVRGALGTFPASDLLALLLAHAGKLAKYGA